MQDIDSSRKILEQLIAFPTVSGGAPGSDSNLDLIDWAQALLTRCGAHSWRAASPCGNKANLFATLGPDNIPGVMLSGHSDVVSVEGQDWRYPPFQLTQDQGKLYGRGSCDMKGFIACALRAFQLAAQQPLKTPLQLALSYDEEIGCIGVRRLIELLRDAPHQPRICIVGEPTGMAIATGHKGKVFLRATCTGVAGHSALAPQALNAIYLATDMIQAIRSLQAEIAEHGETDEAYEIPYTTLHVATLQAGTALNIVPSSAQFDFEIRHLANDDPIALIAQLEEAAEKIVAPLRRTFPAASICIETRNSYPGLDTAADAASVAFVRQLTEEQRHIKVAFGTEGGLFNDHLGIDTVICGPGSMQQGHKPDEYISEAQLARCDQMMERLVDVLTR